MPTEPKGADLLLPCGHPTTMLVGDSPPYCWPCEQERKALGADVGERERREGWAVVEMGADEDGRPFVRLEWAGTERTVKFPPLYAEAVFPVLAAAPVAVDEERDRLRTGVELTVHQTSMDATTARRIVEQVRELFAESPLAAAPLEERQPVGWGVQTRKIAGGNATEWAFERGSLFVTEKTAHNHARENTWEETPNLIGIEARVVPLYTHAPAPEPLCKNIERCVEDQGQPCAQCDPRAPEPSEALREAVRAYRTSGVAHGVECVMEYDYDLARRQSLLALQGSRSRSLHPTDSGHPGGTVSGDGWERVAPGYYAKGAFRIQRNSRGFRWWHVVRISRPFIEGQCKTLRDAKADVDFHATHASPPSKHTSPPPGERP